MGDQLEMGRFREAGDFTQALFKAREFLQCLMGGIEAVEREVERLAVVTAEQSVAHHGGAEAAVAEIGEGVEIA